MTTCALGEIAVLERGVKRAVLGGFLHKGVFWYFCDFRNRLIDSNVLIYIMYA